jgi:hypothetical protein
MKISDALKSLLVNVPNKTVGICQNVDNTNVYMRKLCFEEALRSWPLWDNDSLACPVEGCVFIYLDNNRKWDKRTKYGKRRYDLLNHLIKFFEERGE